jgi:hypothetical protein
LATLEPVISRFVERPVRLTACNATAGKPYAGEVAAMRRLVALPAALTDILWDTPYCRHFAYGPGGPRN